MYQAQKEKLISIIKLVVTIIIFVVAIIVVSFLFSTFFAPVTVEKLRYENCVLLQSPDGKKIDCFGCTNNICKDAPIDWVPYVKPEIGIPFACYATEKGCQLAQ